MHNTTLYATHRFLLRLRKRSKILKYVLLINEGNRHPHLHLLAKLLADELVKAVEVPLAAVLLALRSLAGLEVLESGVAGNVLV